VSAKLTSAALAAVLLVASVACGGDTPPGGNDDGGLPDAGTPDARVATGDSLPLGSISYFKIGTCPEGWVKFASGVGRFVVPTTGTTIPGLEHGTPLAAGEDRVHTHDLSAQVELGSVSYVGIVGGGNGGVSPAGTYGFTTTTMPVSSGLPYVQLLVCFKNAPPGPGAVPRGTMLFFRSNCPSGWSQAPSTQGRFLVGVPEGAPPDVPFGGAPLATDEQRAHRHAAEGAIDVGSHGIALAGGCCGGGYAESGSFPFSVMSTDSPVDLPYVELLQCRKD
jgi:hypothetical protein